MEIYGIKSFCPLKQKQKNFTFRSWFHNSKRWWNSSERKCLEFISSKEIFLLIGPKSSRQWYFTSTISVFGRCVGSTNGWKTRSFVTLTMGWRLWSALACVRKSQNLEKSKVIFTFTKFQLLRCYIFSLFVHKFVQWQWMNYSSKQCSQAGSLVCLYI